MPRSNSIGDRRFPKSHRVRKRTEYLRIQGSGKKILSPNFLAFFLKSGLPEARVGITVSRRVGNAVIRNRVKRLLREAFRQQTAGLKQGFNLVIVAKPVAAGATYDQVSKEVGELCRKAAASRQTL